MKRWAERAGSTHKLSQAQVVAEVQCRTQAALLGAETEEPCFDRGAMTYSDEVVSGV